MEINKIELLSVGIDVGSSTSHLAFSNLVLIKNEHSATQRFEIKERNIIYEGRIINTPLLDDNTIDVDTLTSFLKDECGRAGIKPEDIQTGAVIVTGETAKKHNAPQIAQALAKDAGRFVAATAGPNFESLLAAMGSGATARSKEHQKTVMSCDIGGGTSNLAISKNGEVLCTSCISVGGRLLAQDGTGKIIRRNDPAVKVMQHLGMDYKIGDHISKEDLAKIAATLAEVLIEVMTGPAKSSLAKKLMMTEDLDFSTPVDEYIFSGGVAELIYGGEGRYNDIGHLLASHILLLKSRLKGPLVEPVNKIRATVIGAGAYSLSISGSSGFMDDKITFPMNNVPVLRVDVDHAQLSEKHIVTQVHTAFQKHDLKEGHDLVALYFRDPVRVNYNSMELFARSMETALPNSIGAKKPVILIFEKDVACGVGNVMRRETALKNNLLALDELSLNDGDWIDISAPLMGRQVFPVTVKSLIFPQN